MVLQEELFVKFAEFEEMCKETERARAIYKYALDHIPRTQASNVYQRFVTFEKQHGDREGIEVPCSMLIFPDSKLVSYSKIFMTTQTLTNGPPSNLQMTSFVTKRSGDEADIVTPLRPGRDCWRSAVRVRGRGAGQPLEL